MFHDDQTWVARPQRRAVESEPLDRARREVVQEDVGPGDQAQREVRPCGDFRSSSTDSLPRLSQTKCVASPRTAWS